MIKRTDNPRKQGDAGLGVAIAYFTSVGSTVCVPLTDSQKFDLVIDDGNGMLKRVFVRTTTQQTASKAYECGLRTQGGNKTQNLIRHFDASSVDLLFIACGDGENYLIPAKKMVAKSSITLGERWAGYRV